MWGALIYHATNLTLIVGDVRSTPRPSSTGRDCAESSECVAHSLCPPTEGARKVFILLLCSVVLAFVLSCCGFPIYVPNIFAKLSLIGTTNNNNNKNNNNKNNNNNRGFNRSTEWNVDVLPNLVDSIYPSHSSFYKKILQPQNQ